MIFIKKIKENEKKNFLFFNKFLYFTFFSTITISFVFSHFLFFTSTYVNKKTYKFLDHFSKAGRFEYVYIFNIGLNALKSNFYNIKKLDLEIDFENVTILENHRDKSIKAGSLGNSDQILW